MLRLMHCLTQWLLIVQVKAASDLKALARLIPTDARLVLDPGAEPGATATNGSDVEYALVETSSVRPGDILRVLPGRRWSVRSCWLFGLLCVQWLKPGASLPGQARSSACCRVRLSCAAYCRRHGNQRGWVSAGTAHLPEGASVVAVCASSHKRLSMLAYAHPPAPTLLH